MATSSILTPSQSGIIGEGGRKVLKTRVHVLGRFLMEPGVAELTPDAADRLLERARSRGVRVRTQLTVFSAGLRLGERGIFAAMPIEHVAYSRLSDMVTPAGHTAVLVICIKDYEQRCATILKFKDDTCLRVVVDVINRSRQAQEDDVARVSDLQSVSSELRNSVGGNWTLMGSKSAEAHVSASSVDGTTTTDGGAAEPRREALEPVLADDDDYAVIRKSWMLEAAAGAAKLPQPPPPPQIQQQLQLQLQSQQTRYQKKPQQVHHLPPQQHHSTTLSPRLNNGSSLVTVPDVGNFDEIETAAVFETIDGPPTLLNELVQSWSGGGAAIYGGRSGLTADFADGTRYRRIVELPPEFVARVTVTRQRRLSADIADNGTLIASERPDSSEWMSYGIV